MTNSSLIVYKASAGSGKTFALAAEYVAHILHAAQCGDKDAYKHVLAVTFTVKATGEMKDRILGTLYDIAQIARRSIPFVAIEKTTRSYLDKIAGIIKGDNQQFTEEEVAQMSGLAAQTLVEILHNYDQFKVTTIDSFFQGVLKGVARELELPAGLRTEISDEEVRNLAVQQMMDSLDSDDATRRLVWQYVKYQIEDKARWNVSRSLESFSSWLFKEEFSRYRKYIQQALEQQPKLLDNLRAELNITINSTRADMARQLNEFNGQSVSWDLSDPDFRNGKDRTNSLKKIKKAVDKMEDFSLAVDAEDKLSLFLEDWQNMLHNGLDAPAEKKMVAQQAWTSLVALVDEYQELQMRYNSAKLALSNLHQLGLLEKIDSYVNAVNSEKDQFILASTGALLSDLMGSGGNSEFVFEKIGPRLSQVMIDEFQDTSRQQWNNFFPLLQELMSSEGSRNLIVGDVKQSIYRWRNGDWTILRGLNKQFTAGVSMQSLQNNFRSDPVIIRFNNMVFPKLAQGLDKVSEFDDHLIQDAYADVCQSYPGKEENQIPQGFVRVKMFVNKKSKDATLFDDMCAQVAMLHSQGAPYSSMAILLRASTMVPDLVAAFHENEATKDIKLVSSDAFMLQSSWAVQLLVAALHCLIDPKDRIHQIFVARFYDKEFPNMAHLPLYEINERLVEMMELNHYPDQAEYLMTYLDNVAAYAGNNPANIASFLDYWEETLHRTPIVATDKEALQILTIHKSKGLAFEHVFMPDCDFKMVRFLQGSVHWVDTSQKEAPFNSLPVLPVDYNNTTKVRYSIFADELKEESRQQLLDAINLLYVGFTRARKSLFVWSYASKEFKSTSVVGSALKDALRDESQYSQSDEFGTTYTFGNEERHFEAKGSGVECRLEPSFSIEVACSITSPGYMPVFRQSSDSKKYIGSEKERDGAERLAEGTLFHDILSQMITVKDLDAALAHCRQIYAIDDAIESRFRSLFLSGMKHVEIQDWFSGNYTVFNERTLIAGSVKLSEDTQTPRPDRVMIDACRVVVVDYKFATAAAVSRRVDQKKKYHDQVRGYMRLLKQMMPEREVFGYLWYMRDNQIIEITMEDSDE